MSRLLNPLVLLCCALIPVTGSPQSPDTASPTQPATAALPRDQVIAKLTTLGDPAQQYSLYLPAGYAPDTPAPLLILLDARGRCESTLRMAVDGARANGWIVMSSCQSRSDGLEAITLQALQALLDEAARRYRPDGRRLYLAGFSGTAKTLWTQIEALRGPLAGIIGNGGGRPPELGPLQLTPPAFFGMTGSRDFNYQEMRGLDEALAKVKAVRRLEIFDGPHGWPSDPTVFTAAIDWLQLMAMRDGRAARDEAWIDAQMATARKGIERSPSAVERWRRSEQLVRDFDGLRDVVAAMEDATRLAASGEVGSALAAEGNLRSSERQHGRRFDQWLARIGMRDNQGRRQDPPSAIRSVAELRIRHLQAQAAGSNKPDADSAARVLERNYVATAFYMPEQMLAQGDATGAAAMLEIASAIFPERPRPHWRRAQLLASDNRIDAAFAALAASQSLGYIDGDDLRDNPDWKPLRDDPRWASILAGSKRGGDEAPTAD